MSLEQPQKQHSLAAVKIRELILRGDLSPGMRLTEAGLAEQLGLSRTPVRQALPTLALEGLLVPVGKRGYAVRAFTPDESLVALQARALLEGMAARMLAEQGLTPELDSAFQECLDEGDQILARREINEDEEYAYGEMNNRFHRLLLQTANSSLLEDLIGRCLIVPFVSPQVIAFSDPSSRQAFDDVFYAHRQHHSIVDALRRGESARVEMLLREHAATQRHSMNL